MRVKSHLSLTLVDVKLVIGLVMDMGFFLKSNDIGGREAGYRINHGHGQTWVSFSNRTRRIFYYFRLEIYKCVIIPC